MTVAITNIDKWIVFLPSKNFLIALSVFVLLVMSHISMAQLRRYPAMGSLPEGIKAESATGRTKATAPLLLPFFDDFSKPLNTIFADTSRWQRSRSVWVNDGMAIHPPTLNVATFDGLNEQGMPYNPNEVLLTGYTDTLMSKPIDLSEARVTAAERPTVYLSFFYQWQGNVEPPDEKDFLELSFKTSEENKWETVMTIHPKEGIDPSVFYDTIIQISGERFFHDKFQFMLRTFGRMSGPFDTWHVDYVYLNKGRDINDLSFPDRAISTQLGPIFGKYRAIPRHHFFSNDQLTNPTFEVQNMKNGFSSVNFRTEGYFSSSDTDNDVTLPAHQVILKTFTPVNGTNGILNEYEHLLVTVDGLPNINDPLQFPVDAGIDSTLIRLIIALQTRDNRSIFADTAGDYTPNYEPIKFTTNDTITADYILADYLAYDDGVAEFSAGLTEAGNLVAYEFNIDTTYALKQDTLIGFDIYFPPYAMTSNQTIDFFIYHEDSAKTGHPGQQWLRIASKPVSKKGINEFQRISFLPAILIDEPKFFIGWRQPAAGNVKVGLDISNDSGEKIFVNTNGSWYQNEDVKGSLMLRPVFGSGIIDSRVGIENKERSVTVYPNPSNGIFTIAGPVKDLQIFSLNGASVSFQSAPSDTGTEVRLETKVPGLYLLRYRQGKLIRSGKLIIRQ